MTAPDVSRAGRTAAVAALAAAPFAVDWWLRVVALPRPFWAYWCDPEAMYFYSSRELLGGSAPLDVDNPGTPVQALGALVALVSGADPTSFGAFLVLGYVVILLSVLAACVLLARAFAPTLGARGVVALAWLYALCPQALARGVIWGAEPFQFLGGAVLLVLLDRALHAPASGRRVLAAGVATGALVALKFTFLGFVPALALALWLAAPADRPRRVAEGLAGCALGFALFTLPAASRWPDMAHRVFAVATGGGRPPWVDPGAPATTFLDGLLLPLTSGTTWYALVALLMVGAAWAWRRSHGANDGTASRQRALIVFGVTAVALTHLGAAQATFLRYHLPGAVGAMALLLVVLRARSAAAGRRGGWALPLVLGALCVRQVHMDVEWHARLIDEHRALRDAAKAALAADGAPADAVVLYGGRFPDPAFALRLFARTGAERARIDAAYPYSGLYDRRGRRVELPGGRPWQYLVLEDHDLATFPEPRGDVIATVGAGNTTTSTYRVVRR